MPDFTPLPVYGGVGPVHFNRFRAVFQKPNQASAATLADTFATSFPKFFNSKFATVERGSRTFGSNPTLKFHGFLYKLGIDLGGRITIGLHESGLTIASASQYRRLSASS